MAACLSAVAQSAAASPRYGIMRTKKKTGENPILLLDDVFSELDSTRQQLLVDNMQALQTFITCTGLEDFVGRQTMLGNVFRITNGVAENG